MELHLEIFGFEIKRKNSEVVTGSPIPPEEDGVVISTGYGFYAEVFGGDESKNEFEHILQYRRAAEYPDAEVAIDEISNEAIVSEHNQPTVKLDFQEDSGLSDSLRKRISTEFDHILNIMNFDQKGYDYFRSWYIDGRIAFHKILNSQKNSISQLQQIDALKIRKVRQVEEKMTAKSRVPVVHSVKTTYEFAKDGFLQQQPNTNTPSVTSTARATFTEDSICFVSSGLTDPTRKVIVSYLHKAVKPINQLRMIEDAMVIYRLARAPERRIFYIDVGNLPRQKAHRYVQEIMANYRNKMIYNPKTGEVDDKRKYQSMLEDYWLPRREGGKGTEVTTLPGGQAMNQIDDINYFQQKMYKSLGVPISRLEQSPILGAGRATEISRDELRFNRLIQRLRRKFSLVFYDLLGTQLLVKNIVKSEEWNTIKKFIHFNYAHDNYFAESKRLEELSSKLQILRDANEYVGNYFSKEWIQRNLLFQTDAEISEMKRQIEKEKQSGEIGGEEEEGGGGFGRF
jgi:hypothetical protein